MLDLPLFKGGQSMYAASCVSPCEAHCMSPVPQWEIPAPNTLHAHKVSREPEYCIIQSDSAHASPPNVMGTVYQTQSQGYENTTYLGSPDTWVREPG